MALFMLMLLAAISLTITLVGYFLTPKNQFRNQRAAYQASYHPPRIRRRTREQLTTRRMAASASVEYTEQNIGAWVDLWQSLLVSRVFNRRRGEPTPWMGITLILLSVFLLGVFLLKTLMPNALLIGAVSWPYAPSASSQTNQAPQRTYNATQSLLRLSQLDPAQYSSTNEYNVWAYSACSAASMTEVINAYGRHYRITDILKVESRLGEITPQLGLVEKIGIQRTVAYFGFKTAWGYNLSLNDIIDIANHGRPVIVGFPPEKYAGGHLLVVIAGNADNVYLADSSSWNHRSLSHQQFMNWWGGFSAIVTPN